MSEHDWKSKDDLKEELENLEDGYKELKGRYNKLIEKFLNDIKYRWNKIIEKLTEISENLGLKAEFYFPINDNFGELQEKWEGELKK